MSEMIEKPDANPIIGAVLNALPILFPILGGIGYFFMGQQSKGIAALIYCVVGAFFTCGLLSWAVAIITAIDAYQLGQKLQNGEAIGEKENAFGLLDSLPGFK